MTDHNPQLAQTNNSKNQLQVMKAHKLSRVAQTDLSCSSWSSDLCDRQRHHVSSSVLWPDELKMYEATVLNKDCKNMDW